MNFKAKNVIYLGHKFIYRPLQAVFFLRSKGDFLVWKYVYCLPQFKKSTSLFTDLSTANKCLNDLYYWMQYKKLYMPVCPCCIIKIQ